MEPGDEPKPPAALAESTSAAAAGSCITKEGQMPQKKFYRQRAHCNPLAHNDSFQYPWSLKDTNWVTEHFPNLPVGQSLPTVLDCGCGFGGLTVALASLLPEEVILGLEIRLKVTEYVRLRIRALRQEKPGQYENASVLRTNSMKYLPNFFPKASLAKLFFAFLILILSEKIMDGGSSRCDCSVSTPTY